MNSPRAQTTKICSVHMCRLRGYAHSICLRWFFGTFALKMGQKGLKMGLKCLGFGLVWLDLASLWSWVMADTETLFKLSKIAKLKVSFLGVREEF